MGILPLIELRSAGRYAGAPSLVDLQASAPAKKTPAREDEMPADGTLAARSPGEELGTSRFKGSWRGG
jgi:hypothetical protein